MGSDRILHGLNPEQREAVLAVRGSVCIIAGAGSGKTTTITRRIAQQVATGAFAPQAILAVTFTDKAAGELRSRLSGLGVPGLEEVEARTFHSAALAQLHRYGRAPGQVLASKVPALRQLARSLPQAYRFRPAADLASEVEWAKNRRIAPGSYLASLDGHQPPIPPDLMAGVYHRYERGKRERDLVDFEDLLELAIGMFDTDARAAEAFRDRYRAFTVDEYQDVNLLQQTLLERWLGGREDLCVVGDDHQSIYGFTGATPDHLVGLAGLAPRVRVVRLERNYRSSPEVLDLANRLVPSMGGVPKTLRPTLPSGPAPLARAFAGPDLESRFIVERIGELRAEGVRLEEMALLYRVNFRSEDFEEALAAARIPYQVRDGAFLGRPAARGVLRRLRDPAAMDVAGAVRRAAEQEGAVPDIADDLGEQEVTRQQDLARLVRLAEEFAGEGRTVGGFVADLQARFAAVGEGRGVNLLTYHRAKGLEFDAVFLPRLEEGELPFRRSKGDEALAEERRLLYVGLTRARQYLTLTWTSSSRVRPSRFLTEIGVLDRGRAAAGLGPSRPSGPSQPGRPIAARRGPHGGPGEPWEPALRALKAWRLERSRADGVPAYVVFHDRTLEEIARRRPRDWADLAGIEGVGPVKLDRYADQVLTVLRRTGP